MNALDLLCMAYLHGKPCKIDISAVQYHTPNPPTLLNDSTLQWPSMGVGRGRTT